MFLAFISDFSIYGLLTISFACSMRLLRFPDLSLDAAYALGGAVFFFVAKSSAVQPPYEIMLSIAMVLALGLASGTALTTLHLSRRTRLGRLLCGLIVAAALYAAAFRLNGMATSQTLFDVPHSLARLTATSPSWAEAMTGLIGVSLAGVIWIATRRLFRSKVGLLTRVAGKRPELVARSSRDPKPLLLLGLAVTSSIALFAGALRAAMDNYTDLNTFGLFLVALAAFMLGEISLDGLGLRQGEWSEVPRVLAAAMVGAALITLVIHVSIYVFSALLDGFVGSDTRLLVALVIVVGAMLSRRRSNVTADFYD